MKNRKLSSEEKLQIALEGLKGLKTVSEICQSYKICQATYYKIRDKFLEGGKQALQGKASPSQRQDAEIERLQKLIGKQTIQIDVLKKTEELFRDN